MDHQELKQDVAIPPSGTINPSSTERVNQGFWHVPIPVLPSQIVESYNRFTAPSHIFSETAADFYSLPKPALSPEPFPADHSIVGAEMNQIKGPTFAKTANELINQILDRTPSGGSVVDPDSVIGESLRLYHGYKDGKYLLPNDAAEQDRLDLQHELFRILYDGWLSLAPISKAPEYVLDIGTGTGIWALEFAEQNPSSYVIGTDLSSIQPKNQSVPNCEFIKTDVEDDWIFFHPKPYHQTCGENRSCEHKITFDYIHMRLMCTCFNDPRTVMRAIFDNLAPGGWAEFQEVTFDIFQINPNFYGDAYIRWATKCTEGAATLGRDLMCARNYKKWLEEIGFVDVTERRFLVTSGEWSSDPKLRLIGRYARQGLLQGFRSIGYKMLRLAGMTTEEIETLIDQCTREINDPANQSSWYRYVEMNQIFKMLNFTDVYVQLRYLWTKAFWALVFGLDRKGGTEDQCIKKRKALDV
ncbi:S-adenosyl-L-methionine-dependent methyltransferase [Xylariales sp. PMI_506]|nr:S-adenosyl-L-methionine-dependent methyltransferase [Xylariales sp. PMI_506]